MWLCKILMLILVLPISSELPFTIFGARFFYVYGLCLRCFLWLGVDHFLGAKCFQACLQFQTSIGCKGISMLKHWWSLVKKVKTQFPYTTNLNTMSYKDFGRFIWGFFFATCVKQRCSPWRGAFKVKDVQIIFGILSECCA